MILVNLAHWKTFTVPDFSKLVNWFRLNLCLLSVTVKIVIIAELRLAIAKVDHEYLCYWTIIQRLNKKGNTLHDATFIDSPRQSDTFSIALGPTFPPVVAH